MLPELIDQVALDEAAFLLDLASIDGSWDECLEQVAKCYKYTVAHVTPFKKDSCMIDIYIMQEASCIILISRAFLVIPACFRK